MMQPSLQQDSEPFLLSNPQSGVVSLNGIPPLVSVVNVLGIFSEGLEATCFDVKFV